MPSPRCLPDYLEILQDRYISITLLFAILGNLIWLPLSFLNSLFRLLVDLVAADRSETWLNGLKITASLVRTHKKNKTRAWTNKIGSDMDEEVANRYPRDADKLAFYEWWGQNDESWLLNYEEHVPTVEQYWDLVRATQWTSIDSTNVLHDLTYQDTFPIILVGSSKGIYYKVLIGTPLLARDPSANDKRDLFPDNILGIKDNVAPRFSSLKERRAGNLSEESKPSAESDDYDSNAFHVFHQVGYLMYYEKDFVGVGTEQAMADRRSWSDSGFALVVDVTPGRPRGVWLIYNFWKYDEIEGERYHDDSEDNWGWLPVKDKEYEEWNEQYSRIKIANSIDDLGPDYVFTLDHPLYHEMELVHVVKSAQGTLLRQTVDKSTTSKPVI